MFEEFTVQYSFGGGGGRERSLYGYGPLLSTCVALLILRTAVPLSV
jgi:hypothetical protein